MQPRIRATRVIIVALVIALVSITLVAAAIYYYYTAQVQVNVETPKVIWVAGSDIPSASIGTNNTWCQITIGNLEPNATTVYTNALKFTVGTTGSNNMALQIATLTDTATIIWGIRFYVFTQGVGSTSLTMVDGGNATIATTDGNSAIATVGYRQSGASSSYGSMSVPTQSSGFTGSAGTTYIIVVETKGKDGILTTQSATLQLKLLWS